MSKDVRLVNRPWVQTLAAIVAMGVPLSVWAWALDL